MGKSKSNKTHHTCPFWAGYLLICPVRKLIHPPRKILNPYVKEGMRVLDVGSAMGYFTLPMAEMVGPEGRVYAVDVQKSMLEVLKKRALRKGLSNRIEPILASRESLNIGHLKDIDFCLLFAVVHEVGSPERLFSEIASVMRPGGQILLAEPKGHVPEEDFKKFIAIASQNNLTVDHKVKIFKTMAVLLLKTEKLSPDQRSGLN